MKHFHLVCSVIIAILFAGCSATPINELDNNGNAGQEKYFVRYCSDGLSGVYNVTYKGTDGKKVYLNDVRGASFERTIGPVQKGFDCFFSIESNSSGVYYTVRVEVKKNDEPFVVKKESTASVTYTIE